MTDVVAAGSWTATHVAGLDELVDSAEATGTPSIRVDVRGVAAFDTFGACLLERLETGARASGRRFDIAGLSESDRGLLDAVSRTAREASTGPAVVRRFAGVAALGRAVEHAGSEYAAFATMLGAIVGACARAVADPRRLRTTSFVHQLDRVAFQAIPIVLLITLLIGAIIAQQGIFHFTKFGAGSYVVDLVGILVLRELGVLIVAIVVAGRSGSSYTAELGSMKMREEIDALRTMGLDPVEVLILPRVVALVVGLPLLTFIGSMTALVGGGLVAWLYGGISPPVYLERLRDAISITHFEVGILKAPFMALVIGVVACAQGLRVEGSAESLGLRTTTSVVESIFLVIVLDGLFAMFFASIGM